MEAEEISASAANPETRSSKKTLTKVFDTADAFDRATYGKKMLLFVAGAFLVVFIAPWIDSRVKDTEDIWTFGTTFIFLLFLLALLIAWLSSWRDDDGNWTRQRAGSRLRVYYETLRDTVDETKTNTQDDFIYKAGWILFLGSICAEAVRNSLILLRKPLEAILRTRFQDWRTIEKDVHHYYLYGAGIGLALIVTICYRNPRIKARLQNEIRQFFSWKALKGKYANDKGIIHEEDGDLVINAKQNEHVQSVISSNSSVLFNDFVLALSTWNPRNSTYEYEFQDKLYRHLKKSLPDATIALEYPIANADKTNRGRADMVINETILIEMKRDHRAGAVQRAKGQISQYSEIWHGKGPVILLLCDFDYDHAKVTFTSTMIDLKKLQRPAMTIVATQQYTS